MLGPGGVCEVCTGPALEPVQVPLDGSSKSPWFHRMDLSVSMQLPASAFNDSQLNIIIHRMFKHSQCYANYVKYLFSRILLTAPERLNTQTSAPTVIQVVGLSCIANA